MEELQERCGRADGSRRAYSAVSPDPAARGRERRPQGEVTQRVRSHARRWPVTTDGPSWKLPEAKARSTGMHAN